MGELKPGWQRVKFGDVVRLNKETCKDPEAEGIERVIGLEHLEPGDLRIRSWGDVADGTTFSKRVRHGQVLFGKRRAYQRKIAVADFDAVCSGDIYIFESADHKRLLPELLPFICQTEAFFEYAIGTSAGSLSPRTNWKSLSAYEFALPPLEEQRLILCILTASNKLMSSLVELNKSHDLAVEAYLDDILRRTVHARQYSVEQICNEVTVGIVVNPSSFYDTNGVLAISHSNIERGYIDTTGAQRISADGHQVHSKSWLHPGDVVLPRVSTLQGRPYHAAVVGDDLNNTNAIGILILRPSSSVIPWYLSAVLNAPVVRRKLFGASVGSIQRQLNVSAIRGFSIGLPSVQEQRAIGEKFEKLLVSLQSTQRRVEAAKRRELALLNKVMGGSK